MTQEELERRRVSNVNFPVQCKNCGLKWEYQDGTYDGEHIPTYEEIQTRCPACGSNWFGGIKESE